MLSGGKKQSSLDCCYISPIYALCLCRYTVQVNTLLQLHVCFHLILIVCLVSAEWSLLITGSRSVETSEDCTF